VVPSKGGKPVAVIGSKKPSINIKAAKDTEPSSAS